MPDPFEAIAEVCYCGGDECAVGQYCRDEPPVCHETATPRMNSDSSVGMDDFMRIMWRGDLHRKLLVALSHQAQYCSRCHTCSEGREACGEYRMDDHLLGLPGKPTCGGGNCDCTRCCCTGCTICDEWQDCAAIAHCASGQLSCKNSEDQTCGQCNPGYYRSGNTCTPCTERSCAAGEHKVGCDGSGTDDQTCFPCAAGRFAAGDTAECTDCPGGKSVPTGEGTSAQSFTACAAGQFADGSACTECSAGLFSADEASECTKCPVGRGVAQGDGTTAEDCNDCHPGKYADGTACTACPGGKSVAAGAGAQPNDCWDCAAGQYAGGSACKPCGAGRSVAAGEGVTSADCTPCPSGYNSAAGAACTENYCAAFVFGEGVQGDSAHGYPCSSGIKLSTHTHPSCDLQCGDGYALQQATLDCANDARNGTAATTTMAPCMPQYAVPKVLPQGFSQDPAMHCSTPITDPSTCWGVVCDPRGYFGKVTYSAADEPGGDVVLGGCEPCHGFADAPSVVTGSCRNCFGAKASDCSSADCAPGYHDYNAGDCTAAICAEPAAAVGLTVTGSSGKATGETSCILT